MLKGTRQFILTAGALAVFGLISYADGGINFINLGLGLGLLIAPNAIKDIMQSFAEMKGK